MCINSTSHLSSRNADARAEAARTQRLGESEEREEGGGGAREEEERV